MVSNILIDKLHFKREISVDACFWNVKLYGLVWMTKEYICTNESSVKKKNYSLKTCLACTKDKIKVCQRKAICFSLILFLKSSVTNWLLLPFVKSTHYLPRCPLKEGRSRGCRVVTGTGCLDGLGADL